jgi:UDP-glucose 4-epimerase
MAEVAGVATHPVYAPPRPGELERSALDPERAGIHLGWSAWTELQPGVRAVLDHVRSRNRG